MSNPPPPNYVFDKSTTTSSLCTQLASISHLEASTAKNSQHSCNHHPKKKYCMPHHHLWEIIVLKNDNYHTFIYQQIDQHSIVVDGGNPYNPPIPSPVWTSPYLWLEGILLSISSVKMSYTAAMLHGCISPNNIIVIKMNWCTLQYILILRKIGRCQCHIYA